MIVDAISSFVPEPDAFAAAQRTLVRMEGYVEHFDPGLAALPVAEQTAAAEAQGRALCPDEARFRAMLDEAAVAAWVARMPDRLVGVGGVDPWDDASVADVDRSVRELGMKGFVLSPFKQRLAPTDPRMSKVFAACERLGVPVLMHAGINWWTAVPYDVGHPRHVDAVASAFPKLRIVVLHAGWPWVEDMVMVAWRHRNVFLDISAHRPRHFTKPASGWAPLLHYGDRMLADRVIFGSTWTLLGATIKELVDEVRALPLKEASVDKWLGLNAARVLGIG